MKSKARSSPTMQDIADSLGISRVTVWKVFESKPGVSPSLRMDVISKAKELGYHKKQFPLIYDELVADGEEITVSLVISRPESASFWLDIVHHIAKELARQKVNLLYTHVPSIYKNGYILPGSLKNGASQGMIIINVYDPKMIELIDEIEKPKVFLDVPGETMPHKLNGDAVFLEGRETIAEIVFKLAEKGCTRIGFIGDIDYAYTNNERYQGFLQGLKSCGLQLEKNICLTGAMGIDGIEKKVDDFLENLKTPPDAFICANDQLAYFVAKYRLAKGNKFKNTLITGYDGVMEYKETEGIVYTASVNTAVLGKRLAAKLLFKLRYPFGDQEISYIKPAVVSNGE